MWLVAKFKKNELSIFKENLKIRLKSDLNFINQNF